MKYIDADKQAVKEIIKTARKEITSQVKEAMDSLNEKIAKASKSWKGVDVDKFMDEMRGREPEVDLERELEQYARNHPEDDPGSYRNLIGIARHFAEWGAEHLKK